MVVLSTLMRFIQESRSNTAADKLKAMVSNIATVLRHDLAKDIDEEALSYFGVTLHPKGACRIELSTKKLVLDDIVRLSAGDIIPADLRISWFMMLTSEVCTLTAMVNEKYRKFQ